jgi:hypothetical protein
MISIFGFLNYAWIRILAKKNDEKTLNEIVSPLAFLTVTEIFFLTCSFYCIFLNLLLPFKLDKIFFWGWFILIGYLVHYPYSKIVKRKLATTIRMRYEAKEIKYKKLILFGAPILYFVCIFQLILVGYITILGYFK